MSSVCENSLSRFVTIACGLISAEQFSAFQEKWPELESKPVIDCTAKISAGSSLEPHKRRRSVERGGGPLRASLSDVPEAGTILTAAEEAANSFNPKTDAVVIDERSEGIFVVIVGPKETRVIGEFFLSNEH